ncbi:FAD-dependent thymidylate synthase [candidate division WOR-3 bacterium]|nr:FAD-dependent thymidylate synthase [candidate division WOR-3 bacterium]
MRIELSGITSFADKDKTGQAEAIAASYARCSRSPLSLSELRENALSDVKSARKSNERIVFEMGHKSIAEHVCLNFDISEISRLAVEFLERHRLASFTERSQRYLNIDDIPAIPKEFRSKNSGKIFTEVARHSNSLYKELSENLEKKSPSKGDPSKEDSRYALTLAFPTQLGMTINARSLERMIISLKSTGLEETKEISFLLENLAKKHIPSLVKYTDEKTEEYTEQDNDKPPQGLSPVDLIFFTKNADEKIASALIFEKSGRFTDPLDLSETIIRDTITDVFKKLSVHDPLPRSFEIADFTFLLNLSSCAFAQLKRHRMMTLLHSLPNPSLGIVMPESILAAGFESKFEELSQISENAYRRDGMKTSSAYLLTGAFRRTVLVKMNLREFCHFTRLRMDAHSQWEIRHLAKQMKQLVSEKAPVSSFLCCGKDEFESTASCMKK